MIRAGLVGAVGNTPLIELQRIGRETGCRILVKAEWLNPGGSVKDRAAKSLIEDAITRGQLKEGGTVVEGTAGNTGIGLAHMCNAMGFKCVIYMPDTQSREKIDALRMLGAHVFPVPAVPFENPAQYNHQARRHAERTPGSVWVNQFDNVANRAAHFHTTGPELWTQTNGTISSFVCGTGTGGTLAGAGAYLKEKNPNIKIFLADPPGSVLYRYFTHGRLEKEGVSSITEGIGQGRVTANLQGAPIDGALHIPDLDSLDMVYQLLHKEGILAGASSGLNVAAAVKVAQQLGPGHTVCTVICDSGARYASKIFNPVWLKEKGFGQYAV